MTGDISNRWKNGKGYKYGSDFQRGVSKYGWENIKHEILLDGLSKSEALEEERKLIEFHRSTEPDKGYNVSPGYTNAGVDGIRRAAEKNSRIKGAENKHSRPVLQIEPVTMNVVGSFCSARTAANFLGISISQISNACRRREGNKTSCSHGYFWSYYDEYDPEYFEQFKGVFLTEKGTYPRNGRMVEQHISEERRKQISDRNSIPVICVETGKQYKSAREASKEYGVTATAIGLCLKGKNKSCAGMHWIYGEV